LSENEKAMPQREINLHLSPPNLDVNDLKPIRVTSDVIRLSTGKAVPDGTLVTVFSLKRGSTRNETFGRIKAKDADPNTDGIQIASKNGCISLTINPPSQQEAGVVLAATVEGSAQGQAYLNILENLDTDRNGLPDYWEMACFGDIGQEPSADPDQDGLTNIMEYQQHTDPNKADTDGDGMPDGWEVEHELNPLLNDTDNDPDGDGCTNLQEYRWGTDPGDAQSYPVAPDLTGTWTKISSSAEGQQVSGIFGVENIGRKNAGGFSVAFYLSEDGEELAGTPFKKISLSAGLQAGQRTALSFSKVFTQSVSGKYVIAVVDPGKKVIELEEGNNELSELIP
jgi:hypothetical protein